MKNIRQYIKPVLFTLTISLFMFIFLEGIFSIMIVLEEVLDPVKIPTEAYHSKRDKLLGWISIPNLEKKNYYGHGAHLKINSQSFRNDKEFDIEISKGKIRIICCGDSFTFGQEVGNEDTWCQKLVSINKKLETINMGEVGYGIDQAYLWYMRDGRRFKHDIQIFALITDDFLRARGSKYSKYDKPLLKVINGKLQISNIPIKSPLFNNSWFLKLVEHLHKLKQLRFYEFFKKVGKKINLKQKIEQIVTSEIEIQKVTLKIFETLKQVNKEKASTLVVLYLPIGEDYTPSEEDRWREWLDVELKKRGILFIDLIPDFRKLSSTDMESCFSAYGHYSKKGNELIANILYKKLISIYETAKKIRN